MSESIHTLEEESGEESGEESSEKSGEIISLEF